MAYNFIKRIAVSYSSIQWIVSCVYGLSVAIDSLMTGTLIAYLLRSRTGFTAYVLGLSLDAALEIDNDFHRTDSLVQTLIVYTINTGASRCLRVSYGLPDPS